MTDGPSAATARELRTLRWRITALITGLTALIVVIFAVVAIGLDRQLRDEQRDAELLRVVNQTSSLVTFVDGEPDLDGLDRVAGDVIVGVRPAFDAFVVEEDLWDEVPEMSEEERVDQVERIVDDLEPETLAELAGTDEPIDDDQVRAQLEADPPQEVLDEARRAFLIDVAEEEGLDLDLPTELAGTALGLVDSQAALAAVEQVADDDESDRFEVGDGLQARGVPLRSGAQGRGAVVALVDPSTDQADEASFRRTVSLIGALLIVGAGGAAWLVAGQTIRPAARALAQQERFLADAAHEVRTPIAAIRATAEAGTGSDPAETLARVSALAADAGRMTDDLLTLARMDADRLRVEVEPVRLDLLVEALIDGDDAYRFETTGEVVVACDPRLVDRAVTNLLRNARVHGKASADNPAEVTVAPGTVVVRDHGPGLAPDDHEAVFERFRSGADSSGHGLGLPLARWIARAHGGDVTVDASVSDGTAIRLTLGRRPG